MSVTSTVWEDTDGCSKQYKCDLSIYLMTVVSSSYGIIIDSVINVHGHINIGFGGINTTDKRFWSRIELIGKLASNYIYNLTILPNASKDVSIKVPYQCIHILSNIDRLNVLKVSTKI